MPSSERERDFMAFSESNFPGMMIPETFNNTGDAGDGFPGMQRAIRNWATWWLHSGNMDSGLHIAGYDITGVNLIYADKIYNNNDLTGTATSTISGYGLISGGTGIITHLTGTNGLITTATITTANITNANITNATQDIDFGGNYDLQNVSQITGSFITGQITGTIQLTESLDADTQNIINVVDPVNDQDAATKKYAQHGVASNDVVFSNDVENFVEAPIYTKIKEIIVYRSVNLRVYWESKGELGVTLAKSRVYINGVAVGSEHTNNTTSYVAFTEDVEVNNGDLIQIYGLCIVGGPPGDSYVRYQRIKYIEFVSNDP